MRKRLHLRIIRRGLLRILAALVVLLAILALTGVLVFRSGWFYEMVHRRTIAELERATGGRVEIGDFDFDWKHLQLKVGPVILHGKESALEPPFIQIRSLTAGLRVISMIERKVDLSSLSIDQPQVRIVFYPDGTNNIPDPAVHHPETTWAQDLVHLAVRRYEVQNGLFEYDDREIPLDLRGEDLLVRMRLDSPGKYSGSLNSNRVRLVLSGNGPIEVNTAATFTLNESTIDVTRLLVTTKDSRVEAAGALTNLRWPRGTFTVKAAVAVKDALKLFWLPVDPTGNATFDGKFYASFQKPFDFWMNGKAFAKGLSFHQDRLKVENAEARGDLSINLEKLTLLNASVSAMGATVNGQASFTRWHDLHAEGNLSGLSLREAAGMVTERPIPWSGTLAGGFSMDAIVGKQATKFVGNLGIYPGTEGQPIEGHLDVVYDQAAQTVKLGNSYAATNATRVDFTGTLGQSLEIHGKTTNLDDLMPALAMASANAPKEIRSSSRMARWM